MTTAVRNQRLLLAFLVTVSVGFAVLVPVFSRAREYSGPGRGPGAERRRAERQRNLMASLCWDEARDALARKQYARAEEAAYQALGYRPEDRYLRTTLAEIYDESGRHDRARRAYRDLLYPPTRAASLLKNDVPLLLRYAQLCRDARDFREADRALGRAFANPTGGCLDARVCGAGTVARMTLLTPFNGSARTYPDLDAAALILRAIQRRVDTSRGSAGPEGALRLLARAVREAKTERARALAVYEYGDTLHALWSVPPTGRGLPDISRTQDAEMARIHLAEAVYKTAARLDRKRGVLVPLLQKALAPVYLKEIYGP